MLGAVAQQCRAPCKLPQQRRPPPKPSTPFVISIIRGSHDKAATALLPALRGCAPALRRASRIASLVVAARTPCLCEHALVQEEPQGSFCFCSCQRLLHKLWSHFLNKFRLAVSGGWLRLLSFTAIPSASCQVPVKHESGLQVKWSVLREAWSVACSRKAGAS